MPGGGGDVNVSIWFAHYSRSSMDQCENIDSTFSDWNIETQKYKLKQCEKFVSRAEQYRRAILMFSIYCIYY
jgi:hypothetical protein